MNKMKREIAYKVASAMLTGALAISATGCQVKFSDPVTGESKVANLAADASTIESQAEAADITSSDSQPVIVDISQESQAPSEATPVTTLSDEITYPSVSKYVYDIDEGLGENFRIPQVSLDTEEIKTMNDQILYDLSGFYFEGDDANYFSVDYAAYDAFNGIYTIIIDYNNDGWSGFIKAYTFDANGHVYSNSELLSMAGIDEASFYEVAREATVKYMTNRSNKYNATPMVIDGQANPDHEFADLIEQDLSETDLNIDMVMFFLDGDLYIGQEIMPFADPHSCFEAYTIPDGKTPQ